MFQFAKEHYKINMIDLIVKSNDIPFSIHTKHEHLPRKGGSITKLLGSNLDHLVIEQTLLANHNSSLLLN